ncbi:MAG: hypothetical protein CMJ64_21450 [Planctomycetaceae bacterium]|nr:hypothetical protein [Planctomycetaceae bacterium]
MPEQPRLATIQSLAEQLRRIERGQPTRATSKLVSTGLSVLDDLLPDRGIQPGSIIEWLSPGPGSGAETLAFLIAGHHMCDDGTLVVIDPQSSFYPPAAANLGIDLERTVIVRPSKMKDTLWALEQTLRCAGVAVAVCHLDHLDDRVFRRLQLATETGGGLALFLRPDRFIEQPSWADVRLRVRGQRSEVRDQKSAIRGQQGKKQKPSTAHFLSPVGTAGNSLGRKPQESVAVNSQSSDRGDTERKSVAPTGASVQSIASLPGAYAPGYYLSPLRGYLESDCSHERLLQLELLRCRNNSNNKTILIGIDDETGSVRLVSELASATSLPRAARA